MTSIKAGIVSAILKGISTLPLSVDRILGRLIGRLGLLFQTRAAKVTRENIAFCLPHLSPSEQQTLVKKSLGHTATMLFEMPYAWLGDQKKLSASLLSVENEALLDRAMAADRGLIILLPHVGNWEMFNIFFSQKGQMTALYQPPRQEYLRKFMQEVRESFGNELVPTNAKGILRLYKTLTSGGVVTILPDQVPQKGEYIDFFGQKALTDVLVSRLIKKTNAIALCCTVTRQDNGFLVRFSEPDSDLYSINIDDSLAGLNRSIEASVSPFLDQYQWEYKRFRERPAGEKKLYKFDGEQDFYHQ
jgi:Kdo2-lipid IVA lauroyltransferase/acyltransferase